MKTCHHIYKEKTSKEIDEVCSNVLKVIKSNAARSFQNGTDFVQRIVEAKRDTITPISHFELFESQKDFFNPADYIPESVRGTLNLGQEEIELRNAHANSIRRVLTDRNTLFPFFTGNPGIGKTTAVGEQIIQQIDEGSLLFYITPAFS